MRARGLYARLYRLNYASFDDLPEDLLPSAPAHQREPALPPLGPLR
jgi:hypothetical protein